MAYELIETIEVGAGGAASIEFTSIPQDGTDLVLKLSLRENQSASSIARTMAIEINGSVANENIIQLYGTGSNVEVAGGIADDIRRVIQPDNTTANTFGSVEIYFSNYTSSSAKPYSFESVTENNGTEAYANITAGETTVVAGISSLAVKEAFGNQDFGQYSTASLYKIS